MIIIFDESNGMTSKGDILKRLAREFQIKYVTTDRELIEIMEDKNAL